MDVEVVVTAGVVVVVDVVGSEVVVVDAVERKEYQYRYIVVVAIDVESKTCILILHVNFLNQSV